MSSSTAKANAARESFEKSLEKAKEVQARLQKLVERRTELSSQESENSIVLEEFKNLEDDAQVFKMIGGVLMKQESAEAQDTVEKRLKFIKDELTSLESVIKKDQAQLETLMAEIQKAQALQQQLLQQQQAAAAAAAGGTAPAS